MPKLLSLLKHDLQPGMIRTIDVWGWSYYGEARDVSSEQYQRVYRLTKPLSFFYYTGSSTYHASKEISAKEGVANQILHAIASRSCLFLESATWEENVGLDPVVLSPLISLCCSCVHVIQDTIAGKSSCISLWRKCNNRVATIAVRVPIRNEQTLLLVPVPVHVGYNRLLTQIYSCKIVHMPIS